MVNHFPSGVSQRPALHPTWQIARISRVVADLDRARSFYGDTLNFQVVGRAPVGGAVRAAFGIGSADEVAMRLGAQEIALVAPAAPGRPYPVDSRSNDLWFQHLAIVVDDMDAAYAHLVTHPGWRPISEAGPETLPPSAGGVRAFKFRDPDGHPLELIWFPPGVGRPIWHAHDAAGPFLGIDHSALAVASTSESVAFYQAPGFTVGARSLNHGPEQSRLDGLPSARVRVTSLRAAASDSAGLELLEYQPPGRAAHDVAANDIATDWVTLVDSASAGAAPRAIRDPDGHGLLLVGQGSRSAGSPA
jgi:catechol 2,3-dioxygenase-like lactoylglutathione lyase family enzyme